MKRHLLAYLDLNPCTSHIKDFGCFGDQEIITGIRKVDSRKDFWYQDYSEIPSFLLALSHIGTGRRQTYPKLPTNYPKSLKANVFILIERTVFLKYFDVQTDPCLQTDQMSKKRSRFG